MSQSMLTVAQAASRLGISSTTLYDWLGQSDRRLLKIRGRQVTVSYFQGGPQGQGRIRIEAAEVERILELMKVVPAVAVPRRASRRTVCFPGITVPLGRPASS